MRSSWFDTKTTYGTISQYLHWLIAFLALAMFAMGWTRDLFPDDISGRILIVHKLTGICILALVAVRILWRLYSRPLPLPPSVLSIAAKVGHLLLYAMLLVMPLSGWAMTSAAGKTITSPWGGVLPSLVAPDRAMAGLYREIHEICAFLFASLIGLHIVAALWHGLIKKDDILNRMWFPGRKNSLTK